jgi:AcrR family transcriptional regulator
LALSVARREERRRDIVDAAHSLMRERGDAGFSMAELATQAGVSPATPYNLVGSKADVLRLVVKDEFERFVAKLKVLERKSALQCLLDATGLVVSHYEEDPGFYRALYRMTFSTDTPDVHMTMLMEGRSLWQGLVQAAVTKGELQSQVRVRPFTDVILRNIGAVTLAWLHEKWTHDRFALEMALSVRLIMAGVTSPTGQPKMLAEVGRLQARLQKTGD